MAGVARQSSSKSDHTPQDIANTLVIWKQGNTREYDLLVSQLTDPDISREFLLRSLKGLKKCITELGKEYEVLIGVVLKVDWLRCDTKVVKEYQSFLLNLVSANTFYLRACLRMIVKNFIPSKIHQKAVAEVSQEQRQADEQAFLHLHNLLQALQHLVPMTSTVLVSMLPECQPPLHHATYSQECYARNLLHITQYLPTLRHTILEILVGRMAKLDVRASRQDIQDAEAADDDDDDDGSDMEQDIFRMDSLESTTTEECRIPSPSPTAGPMAHPEADKLDVLMDLIFSYITSVCHVNGELDWESTKKLYRELLVVFDRLLLPTHASCHIQFIMFYIASFKEQLVEGLLDYLWKKVQDPNTQIIFRQAAVAYIASLLARAKYIPTSTVKACLELLVGWVHAYITNTVDSSTQVDIQHHGPFYSVCQALFYVIIFRHKQLLATKADKKYCKNLNLQTIVTCRLNPLRFCLPIVAKTFASITRIHQLAFCDTVLERNKRNHLPTAASSQTQGPQHNPLDSFFPFDPYVLSRSRKYISDLYQEYEGNPVEEEEDSLEDTEESHYSEGSQDDPDAMMAFSASSLTSKTPTDFLMYGTSPGFKTLCAP